MVSSAFAGSRRVHICLGRLDSCAALAHTLFMTSRELLKILKTLGCVVVRQKGSHVRVRCGKCSTSVPAHKGEDIGTGLLASIERDLEPCLGKGWLSR